MLDVLVRTGRTVNPWSWVDGLVAARAARARDAKERSLPHNWMF